MNKICIKYSGIILIRNKIKIKNEDIKFKPVTFVIKRSSQLTWVEVVYHIDGTNLCLYDIETPFDPPEGIITFISTPTRIVLQPKPQRRPQRFPQIEGGGHGYHWVEYQTLRAWHGMYQQMMAHTLDTAYGDVKTKEPTSQQSRQCFVTRTWRPCDPC